MIKYDLILTVVNRGYADEVMKAAKKAGAFGGTVLNARGTGTNELQEFCCVSACSKRVPLPGACSVRIKEECYVL